MQLNPVDYIIIAILLGSLYTGYRQGMLGAVGSIVGFIVAVLLAGFLYHDLAHILDQSFDISTAIAEWLRANFPLAALAPEASAVSLPQIDAVYNDLASFLAGNLLLLISFMLILVVGSLAIKIFSRSVNSLLDGTIFAGVNRGLGAAVVLVKNVLIMAVILGMVMPSLKLGSSMGMPQAGTFNGYVSQSVMANWLLQWFDVFKGLIT